MESKKDKFEFDKLPEEAKAEVPNHLTLRTFLNLASITKSYCTFYKNDNPVFKPIYDLGTFLYHVVHREDVKVQEKLVKDIHLIIKKGAVTDCSGRTFNHISAFEYAVWAKDKHLWTMMLNCIPHNEHGIKIINELKTQLENIEKYGVTYEIKSTVLDDAVEKSIDQSITEKHFDFENTIIIELQDYVDIVNKDQVNWKEADEKWVHGVGLAQKKFPMHVVHEYCTDRAFDPVPDFAKAPTTKTTFYNWTSNKNEDWFATDSKLGSDFAIIKGRVGGVRGRRSAACIGRRVLDLVAMKALCEVRTKDCNELMSTLDKLLVDITQALPNQNHLSY